MFELLGKTDRMCDLNTANTRICRYDIKLGNVFTVKINYLDSTGFTNFFSAE